MSPVRLPTHSTVPRTNSPMMAGMYVPGDSDRQRGPASQARSDLVSTVL